MYKHMAMEQLLKQKNVLETLLLTIDFQNLHTGCITRQMIQEKSPYLMNTRIREGLPWWLDGRESACNVGDLGSIPGLGRSLGGGPSNPLQDSCLENPMDGGAWYSSRGHRESDMTVNTHSTR